jgi:hypothetical protein
VVLVKMEMVEILISAELEDLQEIPEMLDMLVLLEE